MGQTPPPPVDRIVDTCLWKHYLSATTVGDDNWWLEELPKQFTTATHKCVSLFWQNFFGTFHWCRKVTMHKCPHINVLCVAMHKWWNEPKMGDGENWTNGKVRKTESTENLCLLFSECRKVTTQKCFKCRHTSMLKRNLGWVTGKTEPMEKFGKLNWQKICVSCCPSAERSPRKNVLSVATHPCWNGT